MKVKILPILFAYLTILSCTNHNKKREINNKTEKSLSAEFLGNYNGVQPSYNLKNQYGDNF